MTCVCSGQDQSLKQKRQHTNWPQKAPRSLHAAYCAGGLHECKPARLKMTPEKKLISEHFFSHDQNEGKHGSGERRGVSTMWPRIWVTKGREFGKVMSRKYARMGQKKRNRKHEWMYFVHLLVRVLIGWVRYQPIIHNNVSTRYLEVLKLFWPKTNPSQLRYNSSKPELLNAELNDDIKQERRVRQQHRTE